jgi:hypothetical protein
VNAKMLVHVCTYVHLCRCTQRGVFAGDGSFSFGASGSVRCAMRPWSDACSEVPAVKVYRAWGNRGSRHPKTMATGSRLAEPATALIPSAIICCKGLWATFRQALSGTARYLSGTLRSLARTIMDPRLWGVAQLLMPETAADLHIGWRATQAGLLVTCIQ